MRGARVLVVVATSSLIAAGCDSGSTSPASTTEPPLASELVECDGRDSDEVAVSSCLATIRATFESETERRSTVGVDTANDVMAEINDTMQAVYPDAWSYRTDAVADDGSFRATWDLGLASASWWVCLGEGGNITVSDAACG